MAIKSPGRAPEISTSGFNVHPTPLPESIKSKRDAVVIKKFAAIGLVIGCLVIAPKLFIFALIFSVFLFFSGADDSAERKVRQDALNAARRNMAAVQERWYLEAGGSKFQAKLKELVRLRSEYEDLVHEIAQEKQKLQQNLRSNQLHKFLKKIFLKDHNIPGVGPTRKATLASFGIETAADVTRYKVIAIRAFGEKLTRELVNWRKGMERQFLFDPSKGVDPTDIAAVDQRFARKLKQIEENLLAGPELLNQICGQILKQRSQMWPIIQAATQQLKQAKADLSVMG